MKNKKHRWGSLDEQTDYIIRELIREFLQDDSLYQINFDDVSEVYNIKLSIYILHSVLKGMGYISEFEDENGWQYDCWYRSEKEECQPLMVYGCCISNNMTLQKKEMCDYD